MGSGHKVDAGVGWIHQPGEDARHFLELEAKCGMRILRLMPLIALPLLAQSVPSTINYQGRLTDNTPAQMPLTATVNMQFALYDAATSGNRLWIEPASGTLPVSVTNGIFSIQLGGNGVPIPSGMFVNNPDRWLEITANGDLLTPRQKIGAAGYASMAAYSAAAADALHASTADNSTNAQALSGQGIAYFLPAAGTAADSQKLGGTAASGWQKALQPPACATGFLTSIYSDGTTVCNLPSLTETDPEVGSLTTGRVPRWNGSALVDGAWYESGANTGLGTTAPITQLHIAGRTPASVGSVGTGTTPRSVQIQGRYAYVVNWGSNTLQVFDVSNPAAIPAAVGVTTTGANPQFIEVQGRFAYVLNTGSSTLQVFDISNPTAIGAPIGSLITATNPDFLRIQGRYAYVVSSGTNRLQAIDISNPANPVMVGNVYSQGTTPRSVAVQGRYAYVVHGTSNSLQVFDISNPAAMSLVGGVGTGVQPYQIQVRGRYAFVVNNGSSTLQAFDIANPAAILPVGSAATNQGPIALQLQGRHALVINISANSLQIFDISNPASITVAYAGAPTGEQPYALRAWGRHAFVLNSTSATLQAFDLGGAYIQQLETGGVESDSLAIQTDARIGGNAQIARGLEVGPGGIYSQGGIASSAGITSLGGISSVSGFTGNLTGNITGNAATANALAANGTNCAPGLFAAGVDVAGNAEGCAANTGIEFDPKVGTLATGRIPRWNTTSLADGALYDSGVKIGLGTTAPVAQLHVSGSGPLSVGTATTAQTPMSLQVQGRYAYVANLDANLLQIFDVSNPAAIPAAIGSIATGTQPFAVQVQGRHAFVVNTSSNSLQAFDVSNPSAITLAGSITTAAGPRSVYVQGPYAYVPIMFMNLLQVFDVSNPAAIVLVGSVATAAGPRSVHVQGRYAYVANFSGNSLQVIDISAPAAPVVVGSVALATGPQFVQVVARYAYVLSGTANLLQVVDISNPAAPAVTGSASTGPGSSPISVHIQGRYAYVVESQSAALQVFDISNPAAIPAAVGTIATGTSPRSVSVQGRHAFVANGFSNSIQAFDLGGAYLQQVEAGGIETTDLSVIGRAQFNGDAQIRGGLSVGSGGIASAGPMTAPTFSGSLVGNATSASNAATVTNGLYSTGSYSDPAWITTLAGSKITGTVPAAAAAGNFTGVLAGDVTGVQGATVVSNIQGSALPAPGVTGTVLTSTGVGAPLTWSRPVFGDNFIVSSSDAVSTSSSTSFSTKVTLNAGALPAGTYRVGWQYDWGYSNGGANFLARVMLDGATAIMTHVQEPQDTAIGQRQITSGFGYVTLTAGTHTVTLDYAASSTLDTARIGQARLEFWRVQ